MIKREELSNPSSCLNRAHDDEMTFVLLGRDAAAPVAIRAWIAERIRLGKNSLDDPQIIEAARCTMASASQISGSFSGAAGEMQQPESRPGLPAAEGPCAEGLTDQGQGGTACECPTRKFLEFIRGPNPCCGKSFTRDDDGVTFTPDMQERMDAAHRANCRRCLAAKILDDPCPCEGMRRENEQLRAAILPDHKQYSLSFVLSVADGLRADHEAYLDALRACYGEDMGDGCEDTLAGGIERLHRLAGQGIAVRTVFGKDVCDLDGDETGEYLQRARKRAEDAEAERNSLRDKLAAAVSSHTNLSNFAEPMSDVDRLCIEIESERAQKESAQQELAASQERERALRAYRDAAEKYILRLRQIAYSGRPDVRDGARREIDVLDLAGAVERAAPEGNK